MAKGEYKTGGYRISDIYQGSYSSLTPKSEYVTAGSLGMTTDPRSANILKEVSEKLSSGVKNIELATVSPEIFDSIPKQYFKEVNRMAKLTGVDVSLHGPVMDVAGMSQQGFSEASREAAERKVAETLLRSHELNPSGNITVNFHSAEGIQGSQFLPFAEIEKLKKEGIESKYKRIIAVNKESGRMIPLEPEIKYYPGMETKELEKGMHETPEEKLGKWNSSEWENSINQVFFNQERAQEILGKNQVQIQHLFDSINEMRERKMDMIEINKTLSPSQKQAYSNFMSANNYLEDVYQQVNALFSKAYEFGTNEQKDQLKNLNVEFRQEMEKNGKDPFGRAQAIRFLTNELKKREFVPEMYTKIEDFAMEKSAQTFGNAAWQSYKKFKDSAPILVIENPPAGFALSTGEDIKGIVEASRKKFVENAKKEGMGEREAERTAEKFIGATWDVGHINMLRKYGYKEEDIVKETEKVAHLVKHVHLSDNFGFEHTELPMGMGNVPLNEMLKKLGEKGFDAKKIIEAGAWWQHFRSSPFQESLEAMGSPIYGMKMAPYWSQAPGLYQGYFSGYGQMLPQINYETFGAGFSRLPSELGGQAAGAQGSRMSGRPME